MDTASLTACGDRAIVLATRPPAIKGLSLCKGKAERESTIARGSRHSEQQNAPGPSGQANHESRRASTNPFPARRRIRCDRPSARSLSNHHTGGTRRGHTARLQLLVLAVAVAALLLVGTASAAFAGIILNALD